MQKEIKKKPKEKIDEEESPVYLIEKYAYVRTLRQEISDLRKQLYPFMHGYFKGLSMESIAELAKKSIRFTSENSEQANKIESQQEKIRDLKSIQKHNEESYRTTLEQQVENSKKMLAEKDVRIKELETALEQSEQTGKFYVFNPSHGQPRTVYGSFESALHDAKDVALKMNNKVQVLKILSTCVPHHRVEVLDETISRNWLREE